MNSIKTMTEFRARHEARVVAQKARAETERKASGKRFAGAWEALCYCIENRKAQVELLRQAASRLDHEGQTTPAPEGISEPRWRAMLAHYLIYGMGQEKKEEKSEDS